MDRTLEQKIEVLKKHHIAAEKKELLNCLKASQERNLIVSCQDIKVFLMKNESSASFTQDHLLCGLFDVLRILLKFDFRNTQFLTIELGHIEEKIEISAIKRMHEHLHALKNVKNISIKESGNLELNMHSFFMFYSFELELESKQNYAYMLSTAMTKSIEIRQTITAGGILDFSCIYNDYQQFTSASAMIDIRQYFSEFLTDLLKISSEFKENSNDSLANPLKKEVYFELQIPGLYLSEIILNSVSIFQLWDTEFDRLTATHFRVYNCAELSKYYDRKETIETIDLSELKRCKSFAILDLMYPVVQQNQLDLMVKSLQSVRSYTASLQQNYNNEIIENALQRIESGCKQNEFNTLKELVVMNSPINVLNQFIELAIQLPALKCFKLSFLRIPSNFVSAGEHMLKFMNLIPKLDSFSFSSLISYSEREVTFRIFMSTLTFNEVIAAIPLAVKSLEQPIHLRLIFDSNTPNRAPDSLIFPVIKNTIFMENVVKYKAETNYPRTDISEIIAERNSFLFSIVAYDLLVKQYMQFNPKIILADLVEFST